MKQVICLFAGVFMKNINILSRLYRTIRTSFLLIALFILPGLFLAGCIGSREEKISGKFTFPDTALTITVPDGWAETTLPGSRFPLLFGKIEYGIHPNIKLQGILPAGEVQQAVDSYLQQQSGLYQDYTVIDRQKRGFSAKGSITVKVLARRYNNENIPLIHAIYGIEGEENAYIIVATFAEPCREKLEPVFDRIIGESER